MGEKKKGEKRKDGRYGTPYDSTTDKKKDIGISHGGIVTGSAVGSSLSPALTSHSVGPYSR